jgi:VIT1/CCC1 family predicted Fe2+/Mn2+ transporter
MHGERHRSGRIGWLRAAVLGANDGLISTSSLVAGALSMAAGEYVSVSSQADTERADLTRERGELAGSPESERAELAEIYRSRGLDRALAVQVADQLMAHDALAAHARDELGIHEMTRARPIQAAVASAARLGGGPRARGALRVAFWGAVAMACTAGVGALFGAVV